MTAYERISELLANEACVLLDGAMGSELVRRGVRWRWHGLLTDADAVETLHREYIDAGADAIRTNTFQLNRRLYLNVFRNADHMRHIGAPGLETRAQELTTKAVDVARSARDVSDRDVAIAGVMGPIQHCFRPDLAPDEREAAEEHALTATLLAEGGVDFIILESMNTVGEARVAARAAKNAGLPVWASFVLGPEGEILSGEKLEQGAEELADLGVELIMINCAPPDDIARAVERLAANGAGVPAGAYAHIGSFDPPSWKFEFHPQFSGTDAWPPERYAQAVSAWRDAGARAVGGCCGTTPDHIRALREAM